MSKRARIPWITHVPVALLGCIWDFLDYQAKLLGVDLTCRAWRLASSKNGAGWSSFFMHPHADEKGNTELYDHHSSFKESDFNPAPWQVTFLRHPCRLRTVRAISLSLTEELASSVGQIACLGQMAKLGSLTLHVGRTLVGINLSPLSELTLLRRFKLKLYEHHMSAAILDLSRLPVCLETLAITHFLNLRKCVVLFPPLLPDLRRLSFRTHGWIEPRLPTASLPALQALCWPLGTEIKEKTWRLWETLRRCPSPCLQSLTYNADLEGMMPADIVDRLAPSLTLLSVDGESHLPPFPLFTSIQRVALLSDLSPRTKAPEMPLFSECSTTLSHLAFGAGELPVSSVFPLPASITSLCFRLAHSQSSKARRLLWTAIEGEHSLRSLHILLHEPSHQVMDHSLYLSGMTQLTSLTLEVEWERCPTPLEPDYIASTLFPLKSLQRLEFRNFILSDSALLQLAEFAPSLPLAFLSFAGCSATGPLSLRVYQHLLSRVFPCSVNLPNITFV